ncbi:PspA-associated protein PspAB [Actinomadura formosensis]|uniref:PspA-associated protein PspAB n=1 Tax=Actinomadura formosensis TaxID=60706 RepID=UPI00082EC17F|nr:hypothetical protein [Actinomadura formosensis]
MGILDGLLGRPAPAEPDSGVLFALPAAAPALEAATGFTPTGEGGVCHRQVEGGAFGAFERVQREVARLLPGDAARRVETSAGPYGWGWTHLTRPPGAFGELVADLHLVNATLTAAGFGRYLLCSVAAFRRGADPQRLFLVHVPGRGAFYPFAPRPPGGPDPGRRRSNLVETRARDALAGDLAMEPDTARWFPLWDVPGL